MSLLRSRLPGGPGAMIRRLVLVVGTLGLAACGEDGPSGPGTVEVRVEAPPSVEAGAALLEVTGPGIVGFEAAGSARVFGAPHPPVEGRHRVVVLAEGGDLVFRVRVEDVAVLPRASVLEAADRANREVPGVTAFRVRVSR